MSKIEVRWTVDDGYVGKARPQQFKLDLADFADCETEDEARQLIYDNVQDVFEQRISWSISNEEDIIEEWKRARSAQSERAE